MAEASTALDDPLPDVLVPAIRAARPDGDGVFLAGYSLFDDVRVDARIFAWLSRLDGSRTWVDAATVVLPASTWAESDGTFVNAKGLAQLSEKAISPRGDSRPAWRLVAELGNALDRPAAWKRPEDVEAAVPKTARISSIPAPSAGANG